VPSGDRPGARSLARPVCRHNEGTDHSTCTNPAPNSLRWGIYYVRHGGLTTIQAATCPRGLGGLGAWEQWSTAERQFGAQSCGMQPSSTTFNTYSPSTSYLEPSTSSLPSKERIGQAAMTGESQRQRCASLSCLCVSALRVNLAHGQQSIYYIDPHP
jgi:hypothetical protein